MGNIVAHCLCLAAMFLHMTAGLVHGSSSAVSECTHYASPTGFGSGVSPAQSFKIADFWARAKPGYTLCLLDGQYIGRPSMINPPQNLSGTASAPITIRSLNDGKATINGEGTLRPVRLYHNNYFVLEGFNARDSVASVVTIERSNYNIVRRVAAWEAAEGNYNIFAVNFGSHNLLEDVAGWGIARKIFSASQGGNYTTIRRAWGRWEGSHVIGPKMTYTLAYNNYDMICENCIGVWSGERMKEAYTLRDYKGKSVSRPGVESYTNYSVDQAYGIFGTDRLDKDKNARTRLLGSIAYVRATDRFAPPQAVFLSKVDSFEIADVFVYIEPGSHTSKIPFALHNLQREVASNLVAKNLTAIGGRKSIFGSDWKTSDISEGRTLESAGNVFTSSRGANLCYRYKDGVLTREPLWPWPMNRRITDAMAESGRTPIDVTRTLESLFGAIPAACKSTNAAVNSSTILPETRR